MHGKHCVWPWEEVSHPKMLGEILGTTPVHSFRCRSQTFLLAARMPPYKLSTWYTTSSQVHCCPTFISAHDFPIFHRTCCGLLLSYHVTAPPLSLRTIFQKPINAAETGIYLFPASQADNPYWWLFFMLPEPSACSHPQTSLFYKPIATVHL